MEIWTPDNDRFQPVVHFANKLICGPGESWGPRVIGDHQWLYVQRGTGHVRIGERAYPAHAGSFFSYGLGEPHFIQASHDDPFVLYGVHFSPNGSLNGEPFDVLEWIAPAPESDKNTAIRRDTLLPPHAQTGTWPLPFFESLVEEYRKAKPYESVLLRGIFIQLAARVHRWILDHAQPVSPLDRHAAFVRKKLEEAADQPYRKEWLPQWTPYSHDYMSRVFRSRYGKSPHAHHAEMRLEAAKRLLEQTDLTSTVMADKLQFGSVHYFCKWFKQTTGEQPMEYRKRRKQL
ncbi:helix-turn-helix transcriptional regulator [Cohnella nanjingensis]|uniref:Helix-turn-helix transcriptional regulator n=1 Tax=Cohnella nanjingensis TaxID=1387779 RepID=A0A7X0RQ25_9BACL|nr:AraC family transcriptional regulator [Cohnella nanjingensis]MBB6671451.1 helix-turn-helix transcriptional regulator [Cohnella nanjingensis]